MEVKQPINLEEQSLKASSKRELYIVLLNDWKIYIPPIQDVNASYIRGALTGVIKVFSFFMLMSQSFQHIKIWDVKLIRVANFDTIIVKKICSFAESKVQISDYFPTYNTPRMSNRVWFWNLGKWLVNNYLVNTLLPVEFKKWVASKLEERKQLIVPKRRFTVDVLPEFKAALLSSNSVSGSIYLAYHF